MNDPTSTHTKLLNISRVIFFLSFAFGMPGARAAEVVPRQPQPSAPCCVITKVESGSAIATGRENASGRNFQFAPVDRSLMRNLKVGQAIYADFATKTVAIEWGKPCCHIITSGSGGAPGQVTPPGGWDLKDNKAM
jgi:hypothetical protein